eukprot:326922-Rhodomonas_salina.1
MMWCCSNTLGMWESEHRGQGPNAWDSLTELPVTAPKDSNQQQGLLNEAPTIGIAPSTFHASGSQENYCT